MATMFEQLMELPLFRGVTHQSLAQIVGEAKFHFEKYQTGDIIVRSGEECVSITFVISGSVRYTIKNEKVQLTIAQTLPAPSVISPDFLFGLYTTYPGEAVALEDTSILRISKADYIKILNTDPVFLFNYLNVVSANAQKSLRGILSFTTGDIAERLAVWFLVVAQPGSTDISLRCTKEDLSSLLGVSNEVLVEGVRTMKEMGLLDYSNNEMFVRSRSNIQYYLQRNIELK